METCLDALDAVFSYAQARQAGLSKRTIYRLRDQGVIEPVSRGTYRRVGAPPADLDLMQIALKAPRATLCLATALARYDLSDIIPAALDVAIPRGTRPPAVHVPVIWHRFAPDTFDIGRQSLSIDEHAVIGIYDPVRCIIDAFRMRDREGAEFAYEALRRWLRRKGSSPAELMRMARRFPRATAALQHALEVLL